MGHSSTQPDRSQPRPAFVYVGGYGRSGSTVLEEEIASALGLFVGGELTHLFGWAERQLECGCGLPLPECEIWSPVFEKVEHDMSLSAADAMTHSVERWLGNRGTVAADYFKVWESVAAYCRDLSPGIGLTDSSKTTGGSLRALRMAAVARSLDMSFVFIHLTRDPRAVAYSASRGSNWTLEGVSSATRTGWPAALRSAGGWLRANSLAFGVRRRLPKGMSVVIRYESLCDNPERQIERIAASLGYQPRGRVEDDRTEQMHGIAGSRIRRSGEMARTLVRDTAWQAEMGPSMRILFGLLIPLRWLFER